MDRGYDGTIGCAEVVSVSILCILIITSRVLRVVVTFKKPHSILLDFSGGKLYIKYYLSIDLGFFKV